MSVPTSTNLPRSGPISGDDDALTDFDGAGEILRAWGNGLRPDPDLTVSEWADRHRMLSGRASAEPGRYRTVRTPYMREIMDRLSPGDVMQRIVFMKAAQVGATEAGNNWIGFAIHKAPGPMLAVQPTVELAKRNSRQRIDPLIDESPELRERVKPARSRDAGNTMLSKEFAGGILIMTGANSAVGLRSTPARYIFLDEVDAHRLRRDVERAMNGQTGLAWFDAWVEELVETGYLHNHARMWFASIWIFTLGLPWRLGADFLFRQLLDGDAASNTLGWRWVAGLHTRGKPYPATAANIAAFTSGRFTPRPGDLAEVTQGLEATEPDGLPPLQPLRPVMPPHRGRVTALLITDEDCRLEDFGLSAFDIRAAATLVASHLRSVLPVADRVARFEAGALADAAERAGVSPVALRADAPEDLARWAAAAGATQIATGYVTQGPLRDWLDEAAPVLAAQGITFCEWRRDWDSAIWPHATAGFFKVKQQIPRLIDQLVAA